jgi:predicted deacylase
MSTPNLAIYIPSKEEEVDQSILQGISAFNPAIIWAMNVTSKEEIKYSDSLLAVLIKDGIPAFAVETSPITDLSSLTIQQVVEGLMEVTKMMGIIEGAYRTSAPPAFIRKPFHSSRAGIWIPHTKLLSEIKEGEMIGEITTLDLMEDIPVFSHAEGTLIQLARTDVVDTGTSLFTIGIKEKDLNIEAKFHQLSDKLRNRK